MTAAIRRRVRGPRVWPAAGWPVTRGQIARGLIYTVAAVALCLAVWAAILALLLWSLRTFG